MPSQSPLHHLHKEIGRLVLRDCGIYLSADILEECSVWVNGKHYTIDLMGVQWEGPNPSCKMVAVECGKVDPVKIEQLKTYGGFDNVIVIDDRFVAENFLRVLKETDEIIRRQEKRIEILESQLGIKKRTEIRREKKTDMLRIRCSNTVKNRFKNYIKEKGCETLEHGLITLLEKAEQYNKLTAIEKARAYLEAPTKKV